MDDKTLQRIIDEDHFTVEELNEMEPIKEDGEHLRGFELVLHQEFKFQVHYNKKDKRVLVLIYNKKESERFYENDWIYYYSYTLVRSPSK